MTKNNSGSVIPLSLDPSGNPGIARLSNNYGMASLGRANCFRRDDYKEQLDWRLQGGFNAFGTVDVSIFSKSGSLSISGMFCLVVFPVSALPLFVNVAPCLELC